MQETLARAYYAISMDERHPCARSCSGLPTTRPWTSCAGMIASWSDLVAEVPEDPTAEELPDPSVRAALATFLTLPVGQRSAVILKDVLGCSLDEIVESTGATLAAVKAAPPPRSSGLARARRAEHTRRTDAGSAEAASRSAEERALLHFDTRRCSTRASGMRSGCSWPRTAGSTSCRGSSAADRGRRVLHPLRRATRPPRGPGGR